MQLRADNVEVEMTRDWPIDDWAHNEDNDDGKCIASQVELSQFDVFFTIYSSEKCLLRIRLHMKL